MEEKSGQWYMTRLEAGVVNAEAHRRQDAAPVLLVLQVVGHKQKNCRLMFYKDDNAIKVRV